MNFLVINKYKGSRKKDDNSFLLIFKAWEAYGRLITLDKGNMTVVL